MVLLYVVVVQMVVAFGIVVTLLVVSGSGKMGRMGVLLRSSRVVLLLLMLFGKVGM